MPVVAASFLTLLAACSDYGFGHKEGVLGTLPGSNLDSSPETDTPSDSGEPPDPEECNGIDDDGDGEIDEDFGDADSDGVADCLDDSCVVNNPAESVVEPECVGQAPTDPWDVEVKWTVTTTTGDWWMQLAQPVVANLDDDDTDSVIDASDIPEVVLTPFASQPDELRVVEGRDGSEDWSVTPAWSETFSSVAVAEVDGDGRPDIFVVGDRTVSRNTWEVPVARLDEDGDVVWSEVADGATELVDWSQVLIVADLQEDGTPEVITPVDIRDAATGALVADLTAEATRQMTMPVAADIDRDGDQEVIVGRDVYDSDGTLLWSAGTVEEGGWVWGVPLQADADLDAEVAVAGQGLSVYDPDGTPVSSSEQRWDVAGPPCVADFDGDGQTEIAFDTADAERVVDTLRVFEADGSERWAFEHPSTGMVPASCAGWDVDADGAAEVLLTAYAGDLYILDGSTGAVRTEADVSAYHYPTPAGPIVADVDNDGSAEIVLTSTCLDPMNPSAFPMVVVVGHAGGEGWPAAGPIWPSMDYTTTNYTDDGAVVADPGDWWNEPGVFRARPSGTLPYSTDLRVEITDVCVSACPPDGVAQVAVQVSNYGVADARAGLALSLYRRDGTEQTLLETRTLPVVPAGTAMEGVVFDVAAADLAEDGLRVVVDDGDLWIECDEDNNEDVWDQPLDCP